MSNERLRLRVVTPVRVVVQTDADDVQVPAALGIIDILPGHAPLLASLRTGELSYRLDDETRHMAVFGGFVEVKDNAVVVLADSAELPDEIDAEAALAARTAAEEAMRTQGGDALDDARCQLDAANTRIAVSTRH